LHEDAEVVELELDEVDDDVEGTIVEELEVDEGLVVATDELEDVDPGSVVLLLAVLDSIVLIELEESDEELVVEAVWSIELGEDS
jgi:hypothetical protein